MQKYLAEFFGTFWLVLGGCGTAIYACAFPNTGVGFVGVALAFGLTVLTGAYAFGHISGGHFNPAVSVGLWLGGRFPGRDLIPYVVSQCLGAILAAACSTPLPLANLTSVWPAALPATGTVSIPRGSTALQPASSAKW